MESSSRLICLITLNLLATLSIKTICRALSILVLKILAVY